MFSGIYTPYLNVLRHLKCSCVLVDDEPTSFYKLIFPYPFSHFHIFFQHNVFGVSFSQLVHDMTYYLKHDMTYDVTI